MRAFSQSVFLKIIGIVGLLMVLVFIVILANAGFTGMVSLIAKTPTHVVETVKHTVKFDLTPAVTVEVGSTTSTDMMITPTSSAAATGPLRVYPANPRYFTDGTGKIIYLTGSHTWSNFQDNGGSDPPPRFDYSAYLNFLQQNNHNFFRLWVWEQSRWTLETADDNYWFDPMPYERTGPGTALDGKPRFDVTRFNQAYFDRMRSRVIEAGERGIYVSIVLFDGWSVVSEKGGFGQNNPWRGHPFHRDNNINNINGDINNDDSGEEIHEMGISEVTAIQEAYIRKVIDTVNDLDNVLYEISNESHVGSEEWQYHLINFARTYEEGKQKQHPIGMTSTYPNGRNTDLFESPADWISLNGDINNPPTNDGSKVIIADTDHLCGICGDRTWVWKSFTRGENPIFMDGYDGAGYGVGGNGFDFANSTWVSLRRNLGYTLMYANRMNLGLMTPRSDLASTGYCLANPSPSNAEYLVYLPEGGTVTVDLSAAIGTLSVEWFNPSDGQVVSGITTTGGGNRSFPAPFNGDAVLYIFHATNQNLDQKTFLPLLISP